LGDAREFMANIKAGNVGVCCFSESKETVRYWHADSLKLRLLWYIRRTFFESSQIMRRNEIESHTSINSSYPNLCVKSLMFYRQYFINNLFCILFEKLVISNIEYLNWKYVVKRDLTLDLSIHEKNVNVLYWSIYKNLARYKFGNNYVEHSSDKH